MKLSVLVALFFCTTLSFAETYAYRCQVDGRTVFSQHPCNKGTSTAVGIKTVAPTAGDQLAAQDQHAKRLTAIRKLEKVRERDDAKYDAMNRRLAMKAAAAKKRCEAQQMQAKWAKEDLKKTQPRGEMKAQEKLKRAQERADFVCKDT
jgi:hypothetical protein